MYMVTAIHSDTKTVVFPHDSETSNEVSAKFDKQPFQFSHNLDSMEIFQMPALLRLANRCMQKREHKSHFESGEPVVDGYFGSKPSGMTLVEALEHVGEGKNWIILKRIHEDPEYHDALELLITELSEMTATNLRREYHDPILTIFITSPNRITPYHLDGEANFLAQVQGRKQIYLYDACDPYILTAEEMERYWTGHLLAPRWHEELSEGQWRFEVSPGEGVFNPATFPHWVKNLNNISISVSINFKRVRNDEIGANRTNYYMRKMGLHPNKPGRSAVMDKVKNLTFGKLYEGMHATRRVLRSRFGL
jgi:hypothetical protein